MKQCKICGKKTNSIVKMGGTICSECRTIKPRRIECDFCGKDGAYLELMNHSSKTFSWFCSPECLYYDLDECLEDVEDKK